jgi:hypothetical protein
VTLLRFHHFGPGHGTDRFRGPFPGPGRRWTLIRCPASVAALYDAACVHALAAAGADAAAADGYAGRAVGLLRRAVAAGYADVPHLLADPDLAAVRGRADYADLLRDLADPPAPRPADRR